MASSDNHNHTPATSAIEVAGNIDLLTLILTRLAAKPLIRFKSVSKQWLSLISSPRFSRLHTLQNPYPKPSFLFFPPDFQRDANAYAFIPLHSSSTTAIPPFESLRLSPDQPDFEVSSSCNGLLLCSPWISHTDQAANPAYIYNPTTKHLAVLSPPASYSTLSSYSTRYSLAYDPSISLHYKVIMVRSAPGTKSIGGSFMVRSGPGVHPKEMFEIHVYSSETQSWKKHEHEIEWPEFYKFEKGIYSHGAMHWASKKDGFICFDIEGESIRPMPERPTCRGFRGWEESVVRYFGESGGDLHIVDFQGYEVMEIDVYVLERDYSKWCHKYRVDMNVFLSSFPGMISADHDPLQKEYYNFSVLSLLQVDGDEEMVLHVADKVVFYSFKSNCIKEVCIGLIGNVHQRPGYRIRSFDGHLYSESLALV